MFAFNRSLSKANQETEHGGATWGWFGVGFFFTTRGNLIVSKHSHAKIFNFSHREICCRCLSNWIYIHHIFMALIFEKQKHTHTHKLLYVFLTARFVRVYLKFRNQTFDFFSCNKNLIEIPTTTTKSRGNNVCMCFSFLFLNDKINVEEESKKKCTNQKHSDDFRIMAWL